MSETEKTISVIIPVYNTADYLPHCLDSVINNDYRNLEIICVNDGSTDNSLDILNEYAEKDSRIRVITITNGGVSNARNVGIESSSGEFIAFVDSDDWVHRQFFGIMTHFQKKNDSDIIACGYSKVEAYAEDIPYLIDEINELRFQKEKTEMRKAIIAYIFAKLYRRELFETVRFDVSVKKCEDLLFNVALMCSKEIGNLVYLPCDLYYYYDREGSAVHSLKTDEEANAGNAFLQYAKQAKKKQQQSVFLDEAFRLLIKARYRMIKDSEHEHLDEVNSMLKDWLKTEKELKALSSKKSKAYRMFAKHPFTYSLYRKTVTKHKH